MITRHTNPIDQNGTDLIMRTKKDVKMPQDIIFSTDRVDQKQLNYIYNIKQIVQSTRCNEGFGLTTAESIMHRTPATIINITGGLQDQCGLRKKSDGKLFTHR